MPTLNVSPNSDIIKTWNVYPAINHWQAIDDPPASPSTSQRIYTNINNKVDTFGMTDGVCFTISKVEVFLYNYYTGTGFYKNIKVQIFMGGVWSAIKTIAVGTLGWDSVFFEGSWVQADLTALQVRLTANTAIYIVHVGTMYAQITYEDEPTNPYPTSWLKKNVISGYHCFMQAYINAKIDGYDPLKLPDGTIW